MEKDGIDLAGRLLHGGVVRCILKGLGVGAWCGRLLHGGVDRNSHQSTELELSRGSPPSRGRGSKPHCQDGVAAADEVASFTGAWIETYYRSAQWCRTA